MRACILLNEWTTLARKSEIGITKDDFSFQNGIPVWNQKDKGVTLAFRAEFKSEIRMARRYTHPSSLHPQSQGEDIDLVTWNEYYVKLQVPYSLKIMPPSIISLLFAKICCGGIPYMENLIPVIHNKNGRTLWLRQTRGRLELTVPLYIESSYLLASYTPARWQAHS